MDEDLTKLFNSRVSKDIPLNDARKDGESSTEWSGTGLCELAQADGVPCTQAGRSCDICSRATQEKVIDTTPKKPAGS
jgi:hypothetical protein